MQSQSEVDKEWSKMHKQRKESERKSYTVVLMCLAVITTMLCIWTYQIVFGRDKGVVSEASTVEKMDVSQYTEDSPLRVVEVVPNIIYAQFGLQIKGGEIYDYEKMEDITDAKYYLNSLATYKDISIEGTDKTLTAIYSLEHFKRYSMELSDLVDDKLLEKQAVQKRLQREIKENQGNKEYIEKCNKTLEKEEYKITSEEQKKLDKFNSVKVEYEAILVSDLNDDKIREEKLKNVDLLLFSGRISNLNQEKCMNFLNDTYKSKFTGIDSDQYNVNTSFSDFPNQQLSWKAAKDIFERSAKPGGVPVIMPFYVINTTQQESKNVKISKTYIEENTTDTVGERKKLDSYLGEFPGSNNNMVKLFLMLYRKDAISFRDDYYRYVDVGADKNPELEVGSYSLQEGDAKQYWCQQTFYDYDKVSYGYQEKGEGNLQCYPNALINNGLVYNNYYSYPGISKDWLSLSGDRVSKEALEYFGKSTGNISLAEGINFLLALKNANNQTETISKESLHVLDIEPSNEFTLTKEDLAEKLKSYKGEIIIDQMTSQEFNSTTCDLKGTYDLIYLGSNTGGLSSTYNNSDYASILYMHSGDQVALGTKTVEPYSGNDFTESKKAMLLEYVEAGLPVIMASNLYTNTKVDKASNAYTLFETIGNPELKNVANEALLSNSAILQKLIPYINKSRPNISNVSANYTETKIEVQFDVKGIDALEKKEAVAKLFMDADGDGIIEDKERKTIKLTKDGEHTLFYQDDTLSEAVNGLLYKLVVTFDEESNSYTSVTGEVRRNTSEQEQVRILQISPDNRETIDLLSNKDVVGDKLEQVTEYTMELTKISISDFLALYDKDLGGAAYDEDKILTDQLINYDVVVLGFSSDYPTISNENGALDNLIAFIKRKKSVVFTAGTLKTRTSYDTKKTEQAYDTLRELAGMKRYKNDKAYALNNKNSVLGSTGFTYGYLNKNITSGKRSMFNYSAVESWDSSDTYQATVATKVNAGQVTMYPYEISEMSIDQKTTEDVQKKEMKGIRIASGSFGDWQLDLSSVSGYYTVGNEDQAGRKLYSTSPNDMQNNYYLYNCNNVWYSGIGQKKLTDSEEEEAKLFVNTLIAAYETAIISPKVEFLDATKKAEGEYSAFVDADVLSSTITSSKDIKFVPYSCMSQEEGLKTTIYVTNEDSSQTLSKVTEEESGKEIRLSNTRLSSASTYRLKLTPEHMGTSQSIWIYVIVEDDNGVGMAKCELRRRNDFSLD